MTTFSRIIERYGDGVTLYAGNGERSVSKCFVQPVLRRTYENTFSRRTAHGVRDTARYYGFFPNDAAAGDCAYIVCDGAAYDVLKAERYKVRGTVSHWEAVLVKREGLYDG